MLRAVTFAHRMIRDMLRPGDCAVDATAGNGHDTLFLTRLTGPTGMVYAFEIQEAGCRATQQLMEDQGISPSAWALVHASHASMAAVIPASHSGHIAVILFNLGYLPGGDKSITTRTDTTLAGVKTGLDLLRPGGLMVIVVYPGHPGGDMEAAAVRAFAAGLSRPAWQAVDYLTLNSQTPAPGVIVIEKGNPPN